MELDPPSSPTLSLKNRFFDYRLSELSEPEGGAVKSINETHYFGVFLNNVTYTEELYYSFQQ
jgi:hypothetical protein